MGPTHFDTKIFRKKFESVENLSRMCFEHVCFVNHSKCLKEIWVQKYLGAKKILPKILIQIFFQILFYMFWINQECVLNMMIHSLGLKEIWVRNCLGPKTFGSKNILIQNIFPKFLTSGLNLSEMCFEHDCFVTHS